MIFGINDKLKLSDLKVENGELRVEKAKLESRIQSLERLLKSYESDVTKAKVVINFDEIRVFSIERLIHNNAPCTIVGFLREEKTSEEGKFIVKDTTKEWYLYCNENRHEELVNDFNEWKRKNTRGLVE